MQKQLHPILKKDIRLLDCSSEFLLMAKQNDFNSLEDIVKNPISELKKKPGMNYRMLAELGEILKGYELIDIVDED